MEDAELRFAPPETLPYLLTSPYSEGWGTLKPVLNENAFSPPKLKKQTKNKIKNNNNNNKPKAWASLQLLDFPTSISPKLKF